MSRRSYISVDVDVYVDDIVESLSDDDLREIIKERFPDTPTMVLNEAGPGDKNLGQYVEAAFLTAKAMPNCPREISDLFWHVHGRAM